MSVNDIKNHINKCLVGRQSVPEVEVSDNDHEYMITLKNGEFKTSCGVIKKYPIGFLSYSVTLLVDTLYNDLQQIKNSNVEKPMPVKELIEKELKKITEQKLEVVVVVSDTEPRYHVTLADDKNKVYYTLFTEEVQPNMVESKPRAAAIRLMWNGLQNKKLPKPVKGALSEQPLKDDIVLLIKAVLYNTKVTKVTIKTNDTEVFLEV